MIHSLPLSISPLPSLFSLCLELCAFLSMASTAGAADSNGGSDSRPSGSSNLTLESVRNSLIRQEDTIIFSLIERAKYPSNPALYDQASGAGGLACSMAEFFVKESEAIQAKIGRYESPEETPFFPDHLPPLLVPPRDYPQILHPAGASININKDIWDVFFNKLLPLFVSKGDDGNYVPTAASDLQCLQALSRRIHYGKFVAEVKFLEAPGEYRPAIQAQDRDALMNLLTFKSVEEGVKRRVEKKAMVFGNELCLDENEEKKCEADEKGKYTVEPSVVSRLYGEWVMPLTKHVQVEYLLRRLD
ncbi:chorismate mutase 2 [Diospyros lotus]|uniref:chorismate mutase 2 n=1 Tax=Diospyros lotus TaxID=55363 RepID=UPI0022595A6C|nr:chorismate mutase 2 [Diospyros lotus]